MGKIITTKKACEMLEISRFTLYKYVKEGKIKSLNFGERTVRYDMDDIQRFIDGSRTGGQSHEGKEI